MFVAIARIPEGPEAMKLAAKATGLALPDVARLLAGTLPRVLVRATEEGDALVLALEEAGFLAFTGEASAIPSEKERVVARSLEWLPSGFAVWDGPGQRHECPAEALSLLQRGSRMVETSEIIQTTERRLDLGKAVISGGLMLTKKVVTTSQRTESNKEAFMLIQRGEAQPNIIIHERRFNYSCMGTAIQPSTYGNFVALLTRLKAIAPEVPFDDRITRPGFVSGLSLMSVDPMDLALYLVSRARQRGC